MSRIRVFVWEHKRELVWGIIFFLAVTLAFGLGYSVATQANPAPIIIEKCSR